MKIKTLELDGITILAPLAGITNLPFRMIAKKWGCSLVCTEMVSAKGLLHNSEKTFRLLDSKKEDSPLCVQIFGSDPDSMAEAAKIIEAKGDADIIDINFGCSVKKIIKTGAGVALMKEPAAAERLIKAVRNAVSMPFTIKIRSGFDYSGDQAVTLSEIAEKNGVDALTIHPRTAAQGFKGKADWNIIKRLKKHLSIPVIGNGDIITPQDGIKMLEETGCDALMIGRAAMGNPCIFTGINTLLKGSEYTEPSWETRFKIMEDLVCSYVNHFGEKHGCRMLRGRLMWFVKNMPGATGFRRDLSKIESKSQAMFLIKNYEKTVLGKQVSLPF